MACKIIKKDHEVIKYWVNGKPQFIVERNVVRPHSDVDADLLVKYAKDITDCGNEWDKVYNAVDAMTEVMTPAIEASINRLSF